VNHPSRSGVVAFQPRARLLKLIGSELISDDVLAVTELVKNAHDADASSVTVHFRSVDTSEGEIIISDDGTGMDLETLLGQWMQPAANSKARPGSRFTPSGRRMLGEKGVGRFAADKLGSKLELISKKKEMPDEVVASFDWDEFDNDTRLMSEITNHWELRPASVQQSHGTTLRITRPRTLWTERMFRRLSTRLSRLRSPFGSANNFTIRIESDEFPEYSGELRTDVLERAPYRIDAAFDGNDSVELNFNGSKSVEHLWNGSSDLRCGPVRVRIFAFDLETDAVAKVGPRMEVRAWLREWSGISVYRDGFRVWPYGEPHDDWLRLDQRRVNNPVVRLSNNQVVGFVEISRDRNPDLADQTNREGLIHNRALEDLRRLLYFVLQILEAHRQSSRHPPSGRESQSSLHGAKTDSVGNALERLAKKSAPDVRGDLIRLAKQAREAAQRHELTHQRFLQGYADLAALGQAAIGLSRCLVPQLDRLRQVSAHIREAGAKSSKRAMNRSVDQLTESIDMIADRIAMIAPMETSANHRRRALDLASELSVFRDLLKPVLVGAGVEMMVIADPAEVIRVEMRPESFHRLLHILTTNSLEWLHGIRQPKIRVSARCIDQKCEIVFADNGSGVPAAIAERVFDPLFSGREGGQGMGLTIARTIVRAHGGDIRALTDGRRRGAAIRILLPRKRSRATLHLSENIG
jgi:signal transduction histidine kinase